MNKNECFRLSSATLGIRFEDGKPARTVMIPRDSVVEVVSGVETPQKMLEVNWHGAQVMMFVQDIQERGRSVDRSRALASEA